MRVDNGTYVIYCRLLAYQGRHFTYQVCRMRSEDMAAEYMAILGHYSLDKAIRLSHSHCLAVGPEE